MGMSSLSFSIELENHSLQIISYHNVDGSTVYGIHPVALSKLEALWQTSIEQYRGFIKTKFPDWTVPETEISRQEIEAALEEQHELYVLYELENEPVEADKTRDTISLKFKVNLSIEDLSDEEIDQAKIELADIAQSNGFQVVA